MVRGRWVACVVAAGCVAGDDALSALDGSWTGSLDDGAAKVTLVAAFEWDADEELLFGSVSAQLPENPEPWAFAVRRWDVEGDEVYLDLTDEVDPTRGLDLDGPVDGDTFDGTGALSYPCDQGTCGYEGDFSLERGEVTATPTPTASGTVRSNR